MSLRSARQPLSGWGRYPVYECDVYRPERLDQLSEIVASAPSTNLISRGQGRSYGDASLNQDRGVVLHDRLDRFLDFDPATGILHCEAAVTLAEIIDSLLPRGFFLPITPGTKRISVGGAIAADVHGKNHHRDGTISNQLLDFRLLTGQGEVLRCSREENVDLFWASTGGMGLTGAILDARLQLRAVETAYVENTTERCRDLDTALSRILESDRDYEYAVAWIDCLARGRSLGRSVLLRANAAPLEALPAAARNDPHAIRAPWRPSVPIDLPSFALSSFNMKLFNSAFYAANRDGRRITSYEQYFYPLDAVGHWNRIYGKKGCLQFQAVLPLSSSREGLVEMLERTVDARRASFLAVLKSTGPACDGLLSFPLEGTSLALDFPNTGPDVLALVEDLHEIVLRHGGRVYLAKDSCLRPDQLRAMYPELGRFQEIRAKYDPQQRFSSSMARRLGLEVAP
ncbi:MAG: FAD-binding oxidoreductase [Deltaproteobacteria bacterium]|nr:FAD-binding oxidoreductase [Deltaproteobacteria bacterium]